MNYLDCVQELYETVDLRWEPGTCLKALPCLALPCLDLELVGLGGRRGKGLCQCDSCGWLDGTRRPDRQTSKRSHVNNTYRRLT